jgi:acetyl esterase
MIDPELRTSLESKLARAALKLPRRALLRLSGGTRRVVDAAPLDEQAQFLLATALRLGKKRSEELGIELARRELDTNARLLEVDPEPMDRIVERRAETFSVRAYIPRALLRPSGALVYYHGGGFALGSLDGYDALCRHLAAHAGCVVASVDYRLAPEHKFPAAVEDAVAAFAWVREHTQELGVDPERIGVGGDSAGGNLSAVVCQEQKRNGRPLPVFQLLLYPATDLSCSAPSHQLFAKGFFLEQTTIQWFLAQYLRGPEDIKDPRGSPLLEKALAGLPRAMVVTAGFDPLRDEGRQYAEALREAGVRVEYRNDAGMFHGYIAAAGGVAVARDALDHVCRELTDALR